MKLMRYVLTAAALTVAMVSCRKNGVEESEDHPKAEIELTARISDGSSRHWTDDDRIQVYHRVTGSMCLSIDVLKSEEEVFDIRYAFEP